MAALAVVVVAIATRAEPVLSVDSITYISAAEHLRGFEGFVDFTGEPLAHFPPVFSLMLAPGGRSLGWAIIVSALCTAAIAVLFYQLLYTRVGRSFAIVGSVGLVLAQATVHIGATVWSETPYVAFALATMYVLVRAPLTAQRAAAGGALAGLGFLTRYAGFALVLTGGVMVLVAALPGGWPTVRRHAVAYSIPPGVLGIGWVARNLVATGDPLGPHFEGGAGESLNLLLSRTAVGIGELTTELDASWDLARTVGTVVLIGLGVATVVSLVRRRHLLDVGMAMFALTSIMLPVMSRAWAGTDVSARLLAPTLVPIVYFAIVGAHRYARSRVLVGAGLVVVALWCAVGVREMIESPDRASGSAVNPEQFSPELYTVVDQLPADVAVLTNNPQRTWWHTDRVPTSFAFTVPKPGNSHFPLTLDDTVRVTCDEEAYLAWFPGLRNADDKQPAELRSDLAAAVVLTEVEVVDGGTLFRLDVADDADC